MRALIILVVLLSGFITAASALTVSPTLGESFGVGVHSPTDEDIDAMAALGARFARFDVRWQVVERVPGQYKWAPYNKWVRKLQDAGIKPVLILDYSNPLYAPISEMTPLGPRAMAPATDSSRAAFVDYARAAQRQFRFGSPIYEIWNEPDNDAYWRPRANVDDYLKLAEVTCHGLRQDDPSLTILAPSLATMSSPSRPSAFFRSFMASKAARCVDAVSVHPYQWQGGAEGVTETLELARQDMESAQRVLPIVATEFGFSSSSTRHRTITRAEQASLLVKQHILMNLKGVAMSLVYVWRDPGSNPRTAQHNFGLVDSDGRPKPAYDAVKVMLDAVGKFRAVKRLRSASNTVVIELRDYAGHIAYAAWSIDARPRRVSIAGLGPSLLVKATDGRAFSVRYDRRATFFTVTDAPLFVVPSLNGKGGQ